MLYDYPSGIQADAHAPVIQPDIVKVTKCDGYRSINIDIRYNYEYNEERK